MNNINTLKPVKVWQHFENICRIPHPSKHEELIIKYIIDFAKSHSLKWKQDKTGNVVIRKNASPGLERIPSVVLQGHLDMVPQSNSDYRHDFLKDPILLETDGDWVFAKGTTLGADNGIGVAIALAVLESKEVAHGPLEALFTVDEETGMTGATGLGKEMINSSILINLDSEKEGELYVGCAGGKNLNIKFPINRVVPENSDEFYEISIGGLHGGHSGLEISLCRANAIKLLAELIHTIDQCIDIEISEISGGGLRNVIPRECSVIIGIDGSSKNQLLKLIGEVSNTLTMEFKLTDPGLKFSINQIDKVSSIFNPKQIKDVIAAIKNSPNGVAQESSEMGGYVVSSSNLGVISSEQDDITLKYLVRSSHEDLMLDLANRLKENFVTAGGIMKITAGYSGWIPNLDSAILKTAQTSYLELYQSAPVIKVIHAGLECGILGATFPGMDMISMGPTIISPHSPNERVEISSVSRFWEFIKVLLKNVS